MKYCKGYWFYQGAVHPTRHVVLLAAWPVEVKHA